MRTTATRKTTRTTGGTTVRRWHAGYGAQLPLTFGDDGRANTRFQTADDVGLAEFGSRGEARGFAVALDWSDPLAALMVCAQRDADDPVRLRTIGA